jgi:ABC-2 type transport system permease protein
MTAARALHAEWTKLRTLAGLWWLLAAAVAGTVGLGAAAAASIRCPAACDTDVVRASLSGVWLGQAALAVFAVLVVGSEYSTNQIVSTLTAVPRRHRVLVAKAVTAALPALAAGLVGALGSVLLARLILAAGPGTGAAAALSPTDPAVLRAVGGTAVYLGLIALLATVTTAAVRSSAGAIGVVLGALYLFPVVVTVVTDPDWVLLLRRISPSNAGLAIQSTTGAADQAIDGWAGIGVVGLWSAGALALGSLALQLRDA